MSVSAPPSKSEFSVENAYRYDLSSASHWIFSHVWRYKWLFIGAILCSVIDFVAYSQAPMLIGDVAGALMESDASSKLVSLSLAILAVQIVSSVAFGVGSLLTETTAQRMEADARHELYISLLGKSQTFHNRQRVGDIMARATDDVRQLNGMVSPGFRFMYETVIGIVVPLIYIAALRLELLVVPALFILSYIVLVRRYMHRLNPVMHAQRESYGALNAGAEETISGIEIVKASVQEAFERLRFRRNSTAYRDYFVEQGKIEAGYLPLLVFGIALGGVFLHSMLMYRRGDLDIAGIIAVMGLMNVLRFPTMMSLWSFSLVQLGLTSAKRIMNIIKAETELDENAGGFSKPLEGDIVFENVSFTYQSSSDDCDECEAAVIEDISFHIAPGQTVAIVGQTGSGKSTLAQLINRTYDVTEGRVLIDGVDVREWDLDGLRSQISKIEQDVFLFSRSVAENVAFGAPGTPIEQIQQAAREAQAHDFIMSFADGYDTKIGERGTMLSGGQRQRIALARAFLSNPRILILDDSTSAIDSATEDEIQKAIRRAQQGRTTLLITHRLAQIRWADLILVLDHGRLVAAGSHEKLLRSSPDYRRIFVRYDVELPPLEMTESQIAYSSQDA
ncbi:ABC transporter ATP-binding protein [Aggregatilinea lenta]|uniref:ABC transporter ATP-binding protein n=1 Tax=Aggregatilinea lenta TaxID=913108 RepID=UPI000E5C1968|nr:ABC transporter ATP-binding protein [Aggregatilinea lenta]